ncbi:hypothetical protein LCGC14_1519850 [marine sediment metagenome]|uniref:Uncharacterized protein n=1 Tax=marine sediment metagenome TaxID=412755 RepID=A0A0F9JJT5_9ZZZZ
MENKALVKAIECSVKHNAAVITLKNQYGTYGYHVSDGLGIHVFLLKNFK